MRSGVPKIFGSDTDAQRYIEACEVQRADQARQGIRFAVGPAPITVTTPSGRTITSGSPVTVADFHGHPHRAAWSILRDLIREGRVLEADVAENEDK
jgi:hypothetical protein